MKHMKMNSLFVLFVCILFANHKVWCIVTDAEYGRLPPMFDFDDFDQCMLLEEESLYCTFEFQLQPTSYSNASESWIQIKELSESRKNYRHDKLRRGVCLPLACPHIEKKTENGTLNLSEIRHKLAECYNEKLVKYGVRGNIEYLHCQDSKSRPFSNSDYGLITFLVLYGGFVIFATFYEGLARSKPQEEYKQITGTPFGKFISCFSLPKNYYRLKSSRNEPDSKALKCIQGVRFLNMFLVVNAHFNMATLGGPLSNTKFLETISDDVGNFIFIAGSHAVQTFFLISSFLLTYQVLVAFEDKKELSVKALIWMFINRYVRLTPPLAVVLAIHSTLMAHTVKGPYWDYVVGQDVRNCQKNSWTNLLYINNYVNPQEMCMQQSWYLASDTQLFAMGLIILAAMKKFKNHVKIILGFCFIVGSLIPGLLTYFNNYDAIVRVAPEPLHKLFLNVEEWHILYSAGYSNISSYIIGMFFGYIFYTGRDSIKKQITFYRQLFYCTVPFVLSVGIIYVAYPFYDLDHAYSNVESALYWATCKAIFTIGIGIALHGMTNKLGWFALWLCCWGPLQVLGKLTYSVYLIHVFLLRIRIGTVRHPLYYSKYISFVGSMGDATVAYFFAFFFCLFFEMPITALQKMLLPQRSKELKSPPQILVPENIVVENERL